MDQPRIRDILRKQREFFASGRTKEQAFRREQLRLLKEAILGNEGHIYDALRQDLNKPDVEVYGGEIAIVVNEIDHALKNLASWMRPKKCKTPLTYFPGAGYSIPEPYGVAMIIAPWNFPFQLTFGPLVGGIAAGNCALLKPSIAAARSSGLIARIVRDHFDASYIAVVEGGAETAQLLLQERFDCIFFTGGPSTGRLVMQAAARHLTPLILELGGKNPCIVEEDTDCRVAARRIAWGKFYNAGQSCVAVDYLLVHKNIKHELVDQIAAAVGDFYGNDAALSPDYCRIVNEHHFDRLSRLLKQGRTVRGGRTDRASRYIEPAVLDGIRPGDPVMDDEIFGPLLPVLEYGSLDEAIAIVNSRPKPLALYFFSRDRKKQERIIRETSSGGGCINDTLIHETGHLPFGGVGESGMGKYHGKDSFDAFSHRKSIMKGSFLFDPPLRYPPYKDHLKWIRKIF